MNQFSPPTHSLSPRNLKDVETAEKNVLPTADDVKAEKTHQGLIEGVETFSSEKLKSVKTREPASGKDGEDSGGRTCLLRTFELNWIMAGL